VLWGRERETIVNNGSVELVSLFADGFGDYQTGDVELYPTEQRHT
jgi:glutathionyl-hydroquinone reductase